MAARTGLPRRVWRTSSGRACRRNPMCQALHEGHRKAERYGYDVHPAESVSLADAMSAGLGECFHCFPENVPPDAKPCRVLSDGTWVDGYLLEWRRGADGRWKGLVNYRHKTGRRVALKDYPAELKRPGVNAPPGLTAARRAARRVTSGHGRDAMSAARTVCSYRAPGDQTAADSNGSSHQLPSATSDSAQRSARSVPTWDMSGLKSRRSRISGVPPRL